jgi:lipopolysaccharide exporter
VSLAVSTARSAVWMLVGKLVANVAGIVGTIVVINLLDAKSGKAEYGLATAAWLVVATASQISTLGIGQFVVVKARNRPDLAFIATVIHVGLGVLSMVAVYYYREPIGHWIDADGMGEFVPGLILASMLDRISLVPERVLMRSMDFRVVAVSRTLGDLLFVAAAITIAALGGGGMAIVGANIVRSGIRTVILIRSAPRADWLKPARITWFAAREIFTFSGPIWIAALSSFAARRCDNLIVSSFYGAEVMGSYNVAYNLADNPPVVAEQAIDVLLPSYAQLEPEARVKGLVRSLSLLSMITSPLVLGLGAVAPSLVAAFLKADRADVAPMLSVLAVMSLTRPLMWASAAYLQATDRPRILMVLEVTTVTSMVVGLVTLGRISVIWACVAVGIATFVRVIVTAMVLKKIDGIGLWAFFKPQLMPVIACLPMTAAVVGVRHLLAGFHLHPLVSLIAEIGVGGVAYLVSAWVVANPTFRDVLDLAKRAAKRRRS